MRNSKKLFRTNWSTFLTLLTMLILIETFLGNGLIPRDGLEFDAMWNDALGTIWFCELLAFIGVSLYVLARKHKLRPMVLPWLVTGFVSVILCLWALKQGMTHEALRELMSPGLHDWTLKSLFPQFFIAQLVFLIPAFLTKWGTSMFQPSKVKS